jgi:hypothetical protein
MLTGLRQRRQLEKSGSQILAQFVGLPETVLSRQRWLNSLPLAGDFVPARDEAPLPIAFRPLEIEAAFVSDGAL